MNKKIDLSLLLDNAPTVIITIFEKEMKIRVFFSAACCRKMFEYHEKGDSYRSAFAKAIYYMYQQTNHGKEISVTEKNFLNTTDENLIIILNEILEQDSKLKLEYNNVQIDDVYKRFYIANETVLKGATRGISKTQYPKLASVLANTSKPIFDGQAFMAPLQNFSVSIKHINASLAQTLQAPLMQISETIQALVATIDFSLLFYRKEWNEQRETLLKYRWFYSTELPDELVNHIHDNQDELSIEEVDKLIVEYFRKDRCKALKTVVKRWNDLPYFRCRKRVFHEALVNYSRRYFNSSVTMITLHTEGIITDFVRTSIKILDLK